MLLFHLRLALKSLRRTPFYTLTSVVGLAIGVAVFVTAWSIVNMVWKSRAPATPGLIQVQIDRPSGFDSPRYAALRGDRPAIPSLLLPHRDAVALLESRTPARQTATFSARLVAAPSAGANETVRARFCTRDFFGMFELVFDEGGPWAVEDGSAIVLSAAAKQRFFGELPAVGQTLRLEGTDRVVAGVVAIPDTARAWDVGLHRLDFDDVFLPFATVAAIDPRPEVIYPTAEVGVPFLESDASFVLLWVELPDAARRAAYEAELTTWIAAQAGVARRAAPTGFYLRDVRSWMSDILSPKGALEVWMISAWLVLLACTFNTTRMLLAKFLARAHEIGLHRIFGATRLGIFTQHFLEAALLGIAGGGLGLVLATVMFPLLKLSLPEIRIPIGIDAKAVLVTFVAALGCATIAGLFPAWRVSGIRAAAYARRR